MGQRQYINRLQPQSQVNEIYRVLDKQLRANRQGSLYILLQLADRTGQMNAMRWNASQGLFDTFEKGDFLSIQGVAQLYNGNMQLIVNDFDVVPADSVDSAEFDQVNRAEQAELWNRLEQMIGTLEKEPIRKLAESFLQNQSFREAFGRAPAGVKAHHAYAGGLLQHVVDLMTIADKVASCYSIVDRDLLLVGAMLHDSGKIVELSYEGEMTYSDAGQLLGHLVQGVQILDAQIAQLKQDTGIEIDAESQLRLQHMIVSHHGLLEHGSPKVPMTIEAIVLHHIDNMDAKVAAAIDMVESDHDEKNDWTNYNPTMGRKIFKPSVNR